MSSSSDSTGWDVVWFKVLGFCSFCDGSLANDVVASPFLFVLEENFSFFEGKTTLVEVDAVEGA